MEDGAFAPNEQMLHFALYFQIQVHIWALSRENCLRGFANNKGADQPVRPRSLISTFVIRFLESIISRLAMSEITIF